MVLNHDCVRAILLKLEEFPYNTACNVNILQEQLPEYSNEDVNYSCLKLFEAHYIDAATITLDGESIPFVVEIYDITFEGHEFLDNVRSPKVWNETKNAASKIGTASINVFSQIASGIITSLIKSQIGL